MAAYRCVTPVEHDGHRFEPGDAIDVAEEWLAPLLRVGAVEVVDPGPTEQTGSTGGAEDAPALDGETASRTDAPLNTPDDAATEAEGAPSASRRKPKPKK